MKNQYSESLPNYSALLEYASTQKQIETLEAVIEHGSQAEAARVLGVDKRQVNKRIKRLEQTAMSRGMRRDKPLKERDDFERGLEPFIESRTVYKIETSKKQPKEASHFFIPDTQVKPDVNTDYLEFIGKYIVNRLPDVIIHAGDHWDMPSLSSYDRGTKRAEGKRVAKDIIAGIEGMNRLLKPLYDYQQKQLKKDGKITYKPRLVFTMGNHCERIMRHVNANPELDGFLSYDNLRLKDMGWEVYDFLKPVVINGVAYCHFMANPMSGKPYGGAALNILKNVGESFTVGHKQTLDIATRHLPSSGRQQWAIVAGACYEHDEDYKGHQGNHHWRGIIVKHGVFEGSYNPMFVDLAYLRRRYGK